MRYLQAQANPEVHNKRLTGFWAYMQGALSQLDTRNPVLYIDFPEGRLKFRGTLMFPANKYMVLKFGNRDILCEDVLDSMVCPVKSLHCSCIDAKRPL